LAAENHLPVSLESLRQLGVRSYYVLPLTTTRGRVGAIGFGNLHVIHERKETLEFLRRLCSLIAPFLETDTASAVEIQTDSFPTHPALRPESAPPPQNLEVEVEDRHSRDDAFLEILGNSATLREVLKQVTRVAATDATALLLGETGTGKELIARAIHRLSPRADKKFVSVNCTAIPLELLESELFGHEKGAFTGAVNRRIGRLELADGGTLLLDEIGDLPSSIQPKLLRVLQNKEFERLGSSQTLKVDVRLIAATNQDLRQRVAEGRFREDLFYRLDVFPIHIPPLRERKSDIPALIRHFVTRYSDEMKKSITTIPAEAMDTLVNWSWPGNVRELQNLVQRCVILTDSSVLRVPVLGLRSRANPGSEMSEVAERELILQVLKEAGGVIGGTSGAATKAGMKRTTFYSRMKKLNITPDRPQS
jgi:formate hydrogenlyase transcriptional activator